ncbi:glycerate kinase [Tsukamurella strandjordii]|uniref:glycerate kinase family protein n=1 Tax=Tsukamurella strandjordii TaxID=147577 RepID=UPI0031D65159
MSSQLAGVSARVLVAPDSFGGTLTAAQAAHAIAAGWRTARPSDEVILAPQSDGGPGFIDVLAAGLGAAPETVTVSGPLGEPTPAQFLLVDETAYIECAQACGLDLLPDGPTARTALAAGSRGVGELIVAALAAGATTVVVGLGGSACTDGGAGLAEVFGGYPGAAGTLAGVRLIAATDVENPLLGPFGAAAVFGPQKGAPSSLIPELEARLVRTELAWREATGRDVAELPGAGAAGGLGAALLALGAERTSGAAVVASATGLDEVLDTVDLVLTGEGRFDRQSLRGKAAIALAERAAGRGVDTVVLAGQVDLDPATVRRHHVRAAYSLVDSAGSVEVAIRDADGALRALAAAVARELR